jgi:hypothetical protein
MEEHNCVGMNHVKTKYHLPMDYFERDEEVLLPLSKIAGRADKISKLGKLNSPLLIPF